MSVPPNLTVDQGNTTEQASFPSLFLAMGLQQGGAWDWHIVRRHVRRFFRYRISASDQLTDLIILNVLDRFGRIFDGED